MKKFRFVNIRFMFLFWGMFLTAACLAASPSPYSKKIGTRLNVYVFHNFIGENPDIIPSTAEDDVRRYVDQGVIYLQKQFDDFYNSLSGRTGVQRYFARFKMDFSNLPEKNKKYGPGHKFSDCEKIDFYASKISGVCEPVMAEILTNLPNPAKHDAMILCFRVLANEAYKEGLGNFRKSDNEMMKKYNAERADILALWSKNSFLESVPLERDLDTTLESRRCARTIDRLYTLLYNATDNMQDSNKILRELSLKDLQNFITLALNASSLAAMHDFVSPLLKHEEENCTMDAEIFHARQL